MYKFATIIVGLFITSAAFADSDSVSSADALNKAGVNYISIGDRVVVLKTEKTAPAVDALTDVEVVDYAKSFEEAAKKAEIEARRAARQD